MTRNDVAVLEAHRSRRSQRLNEGLALYAADPKRREVSRCLAAIASAVGADRVAVGYLDDLEGGGLRIYCILDLLRERPRTRFDVKLAEAWSGGIPTYRDEAASGNTGTRGNALSIALGGDGSYSWFIVADALAPRVPPSREARDELMFCAGRCAGVLLHSDLASVGTGTHGRGWPLLEDLVGREEDEAASRRIASRFVVVRGLQVGADGGSTTQLSMQADVAASELDAVPDTDPERSAWTGAIEAMRSGDIEAMARASVDIGEQAEAQLHYGSAETCFQLAYDLATRVASLDLATDAARFHGRALRRQGRWPDAEAKYEHARELALAARDHERHGLVISGLAAVARSRGNLPRTRELLLVQLEIGEREGSPAVLSAAHHDLMALDKLAGDLQGALLHGWEAVRILEGRDGALEAMTDLAGVLTEIGAYDAAEDAYRIVVEGIDNHVYRIYALAGLSYLAALRGDGAEFERRSRRLDDEGLNALPEAMQAELLYERGLSFEKLGDDLSAVRWLSIARSRSELWGVNQVLFDVEAALDRIREGSREARESITTEASRPNSTSTSAERSVADGLRAMRRQLVTV